MAVSVVNEGRGIMIPEHVQEKVSQLWNAPSIAEWLTERLTAKEKQMYTNLMAARYSTSDAFPVNFEDLWRMIGYSTKQKAKDALIHSFKEGSDFLINREVEQVGQDSNVEQVRQHGGHNVKNYALTIDCAQQFALEAKTEAGREVRSFFVRVLTVIQEYHLLTVLLAERQRGMEEKHKLLIQQNPSGTGVIYILDMGIIDGVHYVKVGATDDASKRFQGLRSTLEVPPNRCLFVDMIASPNNWAVEKAFHEHKDAKIYRVKLRIKGKNQTETYRMSETFGPLLRSLNRGAMEGLDAQRFHESRMLELQIEHERTQHEKEKGRGQIMRELISAGLTGPDLKDALASMFPNEPIDARVEETLDWKQNVKKFVTDHLEKDPREAIQYKDLRNAFKNIFVETPRTKDMWEELKKHGVTYKDTSRNGSSFKGMIGWKFKDDVIPPST